MSDSQVLEYVKDGIRQGKEQKQLASELARRGVTKEQATRVKPTSCRRVAAYNAN